MAFNGRGGAIYQEVHGMSTKEKRCTHKALLAMNDKDTHRNLHKHLESLNNIYNGCLVHFRRNQ